MDEYLTAKISKNIIYFALHEKIVTYKRDPARGARPRRSEMRLQKPSRDVETETTSFTLTVEYQNKKL